MFKIGHVVSKETRNKISKSRRGIVFSDETKRKMSEAHKGIPLSNERKIKMKDRKGIKNPAYGKQITELHRKRLSESHTGKRGILASNWQGGLSFEPYCPKFTNEFKERVRAFFNYQCAECGTPQNGIKMSIHHVNFNKQACCDQSIPLFVPLCPICHGRSSHNRDYWTQHFTNMITSYYQGKCYFSVEEMKARLQQ